MDKILSLDKVFTLVNLQWSKKVLVSRIAASFSASNFWNLY